MKITKTDIFWLSVVTLVLTVIVLGCAALAMRPAAYDEQGHRAEITKIYPTVQWTEYRDAAREVCGLSDRSFQLVKAMADDDGPQAARALSISTAYLCPERLKLLEK